MSDDNDHVSHVKYEIKGIGENDFSCHLCPEETFRLKFNNGDVQRWSTG